MRMHEHAHTGKWRQVLESCGREKTEMANADTPGPARHSLIGWRRDSTLKILYDTLRYSNDTLTVL